MTTAAEVLAKSYFAAGGTAEEVALHQLDTLLGNATPDADGIRRIVLEGRSGQDATIRGLADAGDGWHADPQGWSIGRPEDGPPPGRGNWHRHYRLTDPSDPNPEEG